MIFEVVVPIDSFEDEKEFKYEKVDEFFSLITSVETQKQIRLMSFGALKALPFEFPQSFASKLQIESFDDISIFYIFILQEATTQNSLNTFSPVILNHKSQKMGQIHLNLQELGLDSLNNILPGF